MVGGVVTTVSEEVSDYYQVRWLGEADEAPIFNPAAVAATRELGGLRRLWLKFDTTPQEYLAWEDVMDRWFCHVLKITGKLLLTMQLLLALIKQLLLGGNVSGMICTKKARVSPAVGKN
jgi:hypothetical protein